MISPPPSFHFFTLVTKDEQYGPMRDSLASVGFDDSNSVFTVLDNRSENAHEPYSAITAAVRDAEAPYVVFCHQDLIFQKGPEDLLAAIAEVDAIDPKWAVLGNAGQTSGIDGVLCLDDHSGRHDAGVRPAKVISLDENFLIVKAATEIGCSPDLSGFHLYATDLVLNAYLKGYTAYVIEYRLTHLGSSLDYRGLLKVARAFRGVWRKRIRGAVIATPATVIVFSRLPLLFSAINRVGVADKLVMRYRVVRTLDYLHRHGRPAWLPMGRYQANDRRSPKMGGVVGAFDRLARLGRPLWPKTLTYDDVPFVERERLGLCYKARPESPDEEGKTSE